MHQLIFISVVLTSAYADFFYSPPYQPSGWRPSGPPLTLPIRDNPSSQTLILPTHQQLPRQDDVFGRQVFNPSSQELQPPQTYGVPSQEYGPPTEQPETETTTTEVVTTTESVQEVEQLKEKADVKEDKTVENEGVYYIYHPTGLLQRVVYMTKDDVRNMAYTAQIKYENVEPIREPIYTYDPRTFILRQLSAKK